MADASFPPPRERVVRDMRHPVRDIAASVTASSATVTRPGSRS